MSNVNYISIMTSEFDEIFGYLFDIVTPVNLAMTGYCRSVDINIDEEKSIPSQQMT